jgi:hypothetical protein
MLSLTAIAFAQTTDPNLNIAAPQATQTVNGTVDVIGTVNLTNLTSYFFEVTPYTNELATNPNAAVWTPVSLPGRDQVNNDLITQWDTNLVTNGVYALRLRVVLSDGTEQYALVAPVRVSNGVTEGNNGDPLVAESAGPTIIPAPDIINPLPLDVGGQMDTMDVNAAELISAAGMTWMKFQVRYTIGDASLYDVIRDRVNFAHENGFRALISIPGNKDELNAVGMAEYAPLYADFVGQVAALQPDAIQIWNEQNIDREWPVSMINGATYVQLLQPSYEAIKATNPDVLVVTGAPAPTGFFGGCGAGGCDDDVYYAQMANAGAANFADCIGVHYNEGILPPTSQGGDPRGEYPTRYLPLMIQRAAFPFRNANTSLCFTEFGYLTGDGYPALPAPFAWASGTSVQDQAEWLRDAITVAATQTTIPVRLMIVFNVNYDRFVDDDPQGGFAIIRPDGSCPACDTIAQLRNDV